MGKETSKVKTKYIIIGSLLIGGVLLYMAKDKIIATISLSSDTIRKFVAAIKSFGITDPLIIAGIISEIYTESKFVPRSETGYSNTSNARIRQIFGSYVSSLTEDQLTALKKDDVAFFNKVYGNRMGNSATEGYKYRGRGLNQLTGKNNYTYYGKKIGIDLVNNPDLANNLDVAIKIAAAFFSEGLAQLNPTVRTTAEAARAALQVNAGLGTNLNSEFFQSIINKQMSVIDGILKTVKTL